tara:strand:- start:1034 stop:1789 length:756 start_codon:yes stop_codon:yes gene_type:complete
MRIFFIIIILLYPYYIHSKVINLQYEIDWKSVHLADVYWNIHLDENKYEIEFLIQSYGLTDKIYNYKSTTLVNGIIENQQLKPLIYRSKTKSSNQDVYYNINFDKKGQIIDFDISKQISDEQLLMQNEFIKKYLFFTDPISQLTQYFLFNKNSDRLIIDGLNIYELISSKLPDVKFEENNPTIFSGHVNSLKLDFPFFQGLHKLEKKNNLNEIIMFYVNIQNTNIPIQYDIFSKKFNAKLFLKNYEINENL